jgi:hypothetical protein
MIDLDHDPNILFYYLQAVTHASTLKENTSTDDIIHLLIGLIDGNNVYSLSLRLHDMYKRNNFHTGERDYALVSFITAVDYKKQHKDEPVATKHQLVVNPSVAKPLQTKIKRFHYQFSLNINDFLNEQLTVEESFQNIIELILEFKTEIRSRLDCVDEEQHYSAKKRLVLEKSRNNLDSYLDKKITLPFLYKVMFQQYEKAQLIPHDTYGAAFMGIFGKSNRLAKTLWNFASSLTAKINNLNYLVRSCKKTSFSHAPLAAPATQYYRVRI